MNGLKCIRTQCNFSLNDLSERIGVSRQLISAWENGKKEIPLTRKKQLSEFFGIETDFFEDISEAKKAELLERAMFRYVEDGTETYRYKPQEQDKEIVNAYFMPERSVSLDEEYRELIKTQKLLMERLNEMILGPKEISIQDQMSYIRRGTKVFGMLADIMDNCFSQKPILKMQYYYVLVLTLQVMSSAWGFEVCDEDWISGEAHMEELRLILKQMLNEKTSGLEDVKCENSNIPNDNKSYDEQLEEARCIYAELKKEHGDITFGFGIKNQN